MRTLQCVWITFTTTLLLILSRSTSSLTTQLCVLQKTNLPFKASSCCSNTCGLPVEPGWLISSYTLGENWPFLS